MRRKWRGGGQLRLQVRPAEPVEQAGDEGLVQATHQLGLLDGEFVKGAVPQPDQLFVIGRDTTFSYKGRAIKAKQVSEELGVQYVLEGSVQKVGDRVRVTSQLIDALKGHHLWADRYDRNLKDLFALLDDITKQTITSLQVKLTHGETVRITSKGTQNLDAYQKVLEAFWYIGQSTTENIDRSKQLAGEAKYQ